MDLNFNYKLSSLLFEDWQLEFAINYDLDLGFQLIRNVGVVSRLGFRTPWRKERIEYDLIALKIS